MGGGGGDEEQTEILAKNDRTEETLGEYIYIYITLEHEIPTVDIKKMNRLDITKNRNKT